MKHWNYRVVKHYDNTLIIHEVYYDDDGDANPRGMTQHSAGIVGDTVEEIERVLSMMHAALGKPILDSKDIGK